MSKKYPELIKEVSTNLRVLHAGIPDVMKSFGAFSAAGSAGGVLDAKTKELIALAIGVAIRCDACIGFHAKALVGLGATMEEVQEMLGVAAYMGGGPSVMYAANAIQAFQEFQEITGNN